MASVDPAEQNSFRSDMRSKLRRTKGEKKVKTKAARNRGAAKVKSAGSKPASKGWTDEEWAEWANWADDERGAKRKADEKPLNGKAAKAKAGAKAKPKAKAKASSKGACTKASTKTSTKASAKASPKASPKGKGKAKSKATNVTNEGTKKCSKGKATTGSEYKSRSRNSPHNKSKEVTGNFWRVTSLAAPAVAGLLEDAGYVRRAVSRVAGGMPWPTPMVTAECQAGSVTACFIGDC